MKKLINDVDALIAESLSGFAAAHPDLVEVSFEPTFVRRRTAAAAAGGKPKVALISGGGSGHEPLHSGFVGRGMLDASCPGQVFTSPTPDQMIAAAHAVDQGAGVLFIVKNYAGDGMNFQMASEMLDIENLIAKVDDDVAVMNSTHTTGRRGVAGTVLVEKIVGAAAEEGQDLYACKALVEKVNRHCASMGVALTSCTVPAAGRATFDIAEDEIEMGVGIHGEPGRRREAMKSADEITADLMTAVLADLKPAAGSRALLMVNGFGATPLMELYVVFNAAAKLLGDAGVTVVRSLVGNYTTALEMAGASVTVCLMDEEMLRLWDAPVHTAALRWGC